MKRNFVCFLLLTIILSTGCTINHPIAKDYEQYLVNNEGTGNLPKTDVEADYSIAKNTINHRYEFRAITVGYAHLWIVEFGKILDETLASRDVQAAFGRLTEREEGSSINGYLISFELVNYEFKDHHAHVSLRVSLANNEKEILNNTYHAEGKSQGSKMFWGGPFAMKNATQQSTKIAVDEILSKFIKDVNSKSLAGN